LSTIRRAGLIFVIKDGATVESGPHHELLKARGLYSQLEQLQHKEEEAGIESR
jgi:ABC-type multidrug transport system fused ATPase/permease subunit